MYTHYTKITTRVVNCKATTCIYHTKIADLIYCDTISKFLAPTTEQNGLGRGVNIIASRLVHSQKFTKIYGFTAFLQMFTLKNANNLNVCQFITRRITTF